MYAEILTNKIIDHVLWMKARDIEYARSAFKWYCEKLPFLDLKMELQKAIKKETHEKKEQIQAAQSSFRYSDMDQGGIQTSNSPKK